MLIMQAAARNPGTSNIRLFERHVYLDATWTTQQWWDLTISTNIDMREGAHLRSMLNTPIFIPGNGPYSLVGLKSLHH